MFKTAGARFIRSVFFAVSIVSWAVLLGACAGSSPPDSGGSRSWVVQNVASKSTAELYADVIKPGVFERSSSKVIEGYTVESGNLVMPDKSIGSLVTVRSGDGSLTALVEKPKESGLLIVDNQGKSTFKIPDSKNYSQQDFIVDEVEFKKLSTAKFGVGSELKVIEIFLGYTPAAVGLVGEPRRHALASVENVNLAFRNASVSGVSMRLVGMQVVANNYPITTSTFDNLFAIFSLGINTVKPDVYYGVLGNHPENIGYGLGRMPGRSAIGYALRSTTFLHELGHNAGGEHCSTSGGAPVPYGYGYDNGATSTVQCGEGSLNYSSPTLKDHLGRPLGNAVTADMGRVWRENAQRLSSYSPPSPYADLSASIFGPSPDSNYSIGCPTGTVMSGRGHSGRMNSGSTNYLCVLPKVGSVTASLTQQVWSGWGHVDVSCPTNSVLNGVEQKGFQLRAGCTKLLASGSAVTVKYAGSHGGFDEGGHQFTCPTGQYITSIRSTGPSGEFKAYDCATLQ